jgi:preprotein translocase subunit SecF
MQKRIIIYGALAFMIIIAIGFKISHLKKELKKIDGLSCKFDDRHQVNLSDLAEQLNFAGCKTKWVAIHLTSQSTAIRVKALK